MELERSSGIILHPTSLPGPGGVGTLGNSARYFVDKLSSANQRWWQILPLNPPGHGGSPYSATSAFAGHPILIDPTAWIEKAWLTSDDNSKFERECEKFPPRRYAIDALTPLKEALLKKGAARWREAGGEKDSNFLQFCDANDRRWLDDFALYTALKNANEGRTWQEWSPELVRRDDDALQAARNELAHEITTEKFLQWQFFEQWSQLRKYAAEKGVKFLGDLPVFVAMDSADAWANRHLFELDESGQAEAVAGVPPDYFSDTGQRWGNPLYDWDALADEGYQWWIDRVEQVSKTVDLIRVDHFRGFESYWRIPADEETAINGSWEKGPKDDIFEAIRQTLGTVPFIAEDLGIITDEVRHLRDRQGLPGMKVLHFAFDGDPKHPFLPHNYPEKCVAYTGTHDNDTTMGWYESIDEDERHRVRTYFSHPDEGIVWAIIEGLWKSKAALTIIPVQDLFALGSEARMNRPGEAEKNWDWRMTWEELNHKPVFQRLRGLTEAAGRSQETRKS